MGLEFGFERVSFPSFHSLLDVVSKALDVWSSLCISSLSIITRFLVFLDHALRYLLTGISVNPVHNAPR